MILDSKDNIESFQMYYIDCQKPQAWLCPLNNKLNQSVGLSNIDSLSPHKVVVALISSHFFVAWILYDYLFDFQVAYFII